MQTDLIDLFLPVPGYIAEAVTLGYFLTLPWKMLALASPSTESTRKLGAKQQNPAFWPSAPFRRITRMPPSLLIKARRFKLVGLVILEEPHSFRIKFTGPELLEAFHNCYEPAAGRSLGLKGLTASFVETSGVTKECRLRVS